VKSSEAFNDGVALSTPGSLLKFDHVGLVVKDLAKARLNLSATLGIQEWTDEIKDPVNGVRIQFGRDPAGLNYELLEPLDDDSPVSEALRAQRTILNHVAYLVEDLAIEAERLLSEGCVPTSKPKGAVAFGGGLIQFFFTPQRFIIELIEAPDHRHAFTTRLTGLCGEALSPGANKAVMP